MINSGKKIELGKMDPGLRKNLLEGKTFKFSEKEREEKTNNGTVKKRTEEEVKARQEIARDEKIAAEDEIKPEIEQEKVVKKPSFEEFKARQETEFQLKTDEARKKLEKAYQEEEGGEKESMAA